MTITILHGENQKKSRDTLQSLIQKNKTKKVSPNYINGTKLNKKDLESSALTSNLFTQELLVIENLLSRTKSKEKESCLDFLSQYEGSKEIILWEKKKINKRTLNKLKKTKPKTKEFKIPAIIFKFLDKISPKHKKASLKLLHQSLKNSSETFIFIMLARRISKLIIAKTASKKLKGAPWQKARIHKQAKNWSLEKLLETHKKMLKVDESIKTGKTKLDLSAQLDLLILEL